MFFRLTENLQPTPGVWFAHEQSVANSWESDEGSPIPFLIFWAKTEMIDREARAKAARTANRMDQLDQAREVFNGSTDTTAASGLPLAELRSRSPCREGGHLTTATLKTAPTRQLSSALQRACLCARTAEDNKAREIVVLDMRKLTPLYDYFVIVTGTSRRQIHTLAEEVDAALHAEGDTRMGIEGYEASKWVVQDYGDILVHVFDPDTRQYYNLEELWADAKRIDWERED